MPLLLAAAPGAVDVPALLLVFVIVMVATRLFGEGAQRMGQPAVLGELLAGVLLGGSVLGVLDPADPVMHTFAEIGVLILLFEIGMHTDLRALGAVFKPAVTVGTVGVVLPFALGYGVASFMGLDTIPALVTGAALTATSIGISARVLSDLGRLQTPEGRVVLGAAVYDDVVGLIILSVVSGIVAGGSLTLGGVARISAVAIGFVVAAVALGLLVVSRIFRVVERIQTAGAVGVIALAFAFALAWLADAVGSAVIIGAFAAGVVLHSVPQRRQIENSIAPLGHLFVPFFFAVVGASVDLAAASSPRALMIGGALIVVGFLGKFLAGLSPWWFRGDRTLIGVAMVPRGEVGLIFAQMGLATGAIGPDLFGALMLMVLVTTFVTPPLLGLVARKHAAADEEAAPGEGGIDDLVVGMQRPRRRATDPGVAAVPGPAPLDYDQLAEEQPASPRPLVERRRAPADE